MPPTWAKALEVLHTNNAAPPIPPMTREQIRQYSGCGSDVLTALHRLGVIRQFEYNGRMYPTLSNAVAVPTAAEIREKIKEMNQRRDNVYVELLHAGYIVPKTEKDVAAFEQGVKHHNIPPLPDDLDDPAGILKRVKAKPEPVASLSEAIAVITAAGGTVVFGDKKQ